MTTTEQLAVELSVLATWRDDFTGTLARSATELRRLAAIEATAKKLVTAKGRYHTECNYKALEALMKETP